MEEFDNKIEFLTGEFSYKFDREKYILTLFTNKEQDLINIQRENIKKIYDMKNITLISKERRYKWYVDKCMYCFANEITFKVKYFIRYFNKDVGINKIEFTSDIIKQIFHPAKYFYGNIKKAQNDILYNKIILKEFDFSKDDIKFNVKLSIGELLKSGICSKFSDFVKLQIETDKELDIEAIIRILGSLKDTFNIIGLTKKFSFENIELFSNESIVAIIDEPIIKVSTLLPNVNLYFNEIFERIMKYSMQKKEIEYRFFEDNNSEINFFFLCRTFEQNFKIRFPNYKSPKRTKIEDEIITLLLDILESKKENDFIKGLKNTLNKYRNKFFDQLLFTFENYENYFVEAKNYCFAKDSIKYLKYSNLLNMKDDGFETSVRRISELRNKMAHEDLNVNFSMIDKFWINAFGYIVYIMILENIGLIKEEIFEILEDIHISMID